ncbi:MAG: 30S ribosomal protein S8 [Candidatus Aenigmatarchaeota archaeon]
MIHDVLADVLSALKNNDRLGKKEATVPASKMAKDVLLILQANDFIGNFEFIDDRRGGKFKVSLIGNINGCGAVRPRFAVKKDEYNRYEMRFLPAAGFGFLIVSTPQGVMNHEEAKKKGLGGRLIAFVY